MRYAKAIIGPQAEAPSRPRPNVHSRGVEPAHHSRRRTSQCLHQRMFLIFSVSGHVCALLLRRYPRISLRLILLPPPAARVLMISCTGRLCGLWRTDLNAIYLFFCFLFGFYLPCLVGQRRSLHDLLLLLYILVCNESVRV